MMKRLLILLGLFSFLVAPGTVLADHLKGRILLQVENHGEAWYVGPVSGQRYYMKDGAMAYEMLRAFGLGISDADLEKIPVGIEERFPVGTDTDGDGLSDQLETGLGSNFEKTDSDTDGQADKQEVLQNTLPTGAGERIIDQELIKNLSGRILLQVQKNGEAWYLRPDDNKRYYLPDGEAAYQIMRFLSLGISNKDLSLIPVDTLKDEPVAWGDTIQRETITVNLGATPYTVHVLKFNLRDPRLSIITESANATDCADDCAARSLGDFILSHEAVAGINGSYFCPADYASCASKSNYYFYPVFNSRTRTMINQEQTKWPTTGGMLAFDDQNTPYFYAAASQFGSPEQFQKETGRSLQAAIGNDLLIVREGYNLINSANLDAKQNTSRVDRAAVGVRDNWLHLVVAQKATVMNLADILVQMGMKNALNLDAGYSTALYYDGRYRLGPGRDIPNALLFKYKL